MASVLLAVCFVIAKKKSQNFCPVFVFILSCICLILLYIQLNFVLHLFEFGVAFVWGSIHKLAATGNKIIGRAARELSVSAEW